MTLVWRIYICEVRQRGSSRSGWSRRANYHIPLSASRRYTFPWVRSRFRSSLLNKQSLYCRSRATQSPHLNPVIFYCGFHPRATLLHPRSPSRFTRSIPSVVAQRVRVYFYFYVCWWNQIFIPRVLSARAVVSLVSADIRDDVTLAWILFMWQPMGFAERHVQRGVKRRDDTSAAAAASHLFCKRAFGVSELRPDKDGELCCEYTRAVSTRVGWNVRINRSAVFVRGTLVSPFT